MKLLRDLRPEDWAMYPHMQSGGARSFFQKTSNSVEQTNAAIGPLRSMAPLQFVQGMVTRAADFFCKRQRLVDSFAAQLPQPRLVSPFADAAFTRQKVGSSCTVTHFVFLLCVADMASFLLFSSS